MTRLPSRGRFARLRSSSLIVCTLVLTLGVACAKLQTTAPAVAPRPMDLEQTRAALVKYQDVIAAVHDGYFSTIGCVEYPEGGMGIHFVNMTLLGPVPDPMRPQILLYEPVGDKLVLVGAEWFIPLSTGVKEHPRLFGQPFDGPMDGHTPLQPASLRHYDLHVWLFKPNSLGMFKRANPDVKCPVGGYTVRH
ncbi:MAG TPA: hypothetical protein VLD61_01900 [Methylomirabilota bacterium]|nr:hypothetical protein [Methylomirabilota bacterium]